VGGVVHGFVVAADVRRLDLFPVLRISDSA
jgi:hypothetical protein